MKVWVVRPNDPKTVGEIVVRAREDLAAIDEGRVFIGKKRVTAASAPVKAGDEVRIGKRDSALADVPVLVDEDDLVAVAKPAGIPTVPDHRGSSHSLVAVVARMLKKKPGELRVTSRLDREVSGAVVFALSEEAERRLKAARARGEYERRYVAIGAGRPTELEGLWGTPIDEKESGTRYRVVARTGDFVMLACDPITGRTHQIRIHASRAKLPLVGDSVYGGPTSITLDNGRVVALSRIALHAARVAVAGIVAEAPIPEELTRVWSDLGGAGDAWELAITSRT